MLIEEVLVCYHSEGHSTSESLTSSVVSLASVLDQTYKIVQAKFQVSRMRLEWAQEEMEILEMCLARAKLLQDRDISYIDSNSDLNSDAASDWDAHSDTDADSDSNGDFYRLGPCVFRFM